MKNAFWWPRFDDLSRVDRLSEVLFGLLMVLTFTCTMPLALGDGVTVTAVLWAALGCNIAWGIIDGIMSIIRTAADRGRRINLLTSFKNQDSREQTRMTQAWWQSDVVPVALPDDLANDLSKVMSDLPEQPKRFILREDIGVSVAITLLVIASTLPPTLPFVFIADLDTALRVSNAVAIFMMFVIGYRLDKYMGEKVILMRWLVPLCGVAMVLIAIALGG